MSTMRNLRNMVGDREMDYSISCLPFDSGTLRFLLKLLQEWAVCLNREQSHLIYNFSSPGSPGKSHSFT